MARKSRYFHDFPSCSRTHTTLRIYHASEDPQRVTDALRIQPDYTRMVGELIRRGVKAPVSSWSLGTKDKKTVSESKDMRAHVDWLLNKLSTKKKEIRKLTELGYTIMITCLWESSSGNGGPVLDQAFMKRLSEFPLELHFDIWFDVEEMFGKGKKK